MTKKKPTGKAPGGRRTKGPVPYDMRVRIVREVLRGSGQLDVAMAFGVSHAAVQKYLGLYRRGGMDALKPRWEAKRAAAPAKRQSPRRQAVVEARTEHPEWGTRRIRDVLARFEGLGVSETVVRRILHEEGLIDERTPAPARSHSPRRFERAAPNQLWQSDIFTFLLRKHERLYVAAFMDDHSRYLVAYALAHHQKSSLVLEAFERGVASYGAPEEVLTDQGRQYTAWRGQTAFEETLRQHGIRHVKSRPQHPETLGKIERYWKTLWQELLSRTVFADFADCDRRLGLYVQHYNFQRPHQALSGLVPADRFFRAAPQVRAAVEGTIAANALRLARSQPPRKPFYLVGRLGDQDLSIAAQAGALTVKVGDAAQTIHLSRGDDDEATTISDDETCEAAAATPQGATAADPSLADGTDGPRPGGAAPLPPGPERDLGGEAGDDCDPGAPDLAPLLLPARDPGAAGDAERPGAGRGDDDEPGRRDAGPADRRARETGDAARAGEPATGTALVAGEAARASGPDQPGAGQAAAATALDDEWLARFAEIDDEAEDGRRDPIELDPDDGWRGRALRWDRKLAGVVAPWQGRPDREDDDGQETATEREVELQASTEGAAGPDGPVSGGRAGHRGTDERERGCSPARHGAGELPDAGQPDQGVDGHDPDAAPGRAGAAASRGGGAVARGGDAAQRQRAPDQTAPHDGPASWGRGGRDPGAPAAGETPNVQELAASLDALLDRRRRGTAATESDDDVPDADWIDFGGMGGDDDA